jgi:hypothetical protein
MSINRDLANIISGGFTSADIPNLDASKITSGTIDNARLNVQSFDDNKIVNDISTLALRQASNENKAAYNTNSMFVDVFQDSTGIDTTTNTTRNASEYVDTKELTTGTQQYLQNSDVSYSSGNSQFDTIDTTNNTSRQKFNATVAGGNHCTWSNSAVLTDNFVWRYTVASYGYSSASSSNRWFQFGVVPNTTNLSTGNSLYNAFSSGQEGFALLNNGAGQTGINFANGNSTEGTSSVTLASGDILEIARTGSTLEYYRTPNGGSRTLLYTSDNFNSTADYYAVISDGYNSSGQVQNQPQFLEVNYRNDVLSANATGNFTGTNITAPSSVSSMGAIITYQDNAGTNALNTDIVLKLSADGGSNYSTATLVAMPDFSSGIKMAKVNDLAVTAGTSLKYKIEFANQANGSKEARIRGVALQY